MEPLLDARTLPSAGDDPRLMDEALSEARAAAAHDDIPIGAVVVRGGAIVARGHNRREIEHDPTAHAEVLALRAAGIALGRWRLGDAALYVTVEPCAMCAGAIVLARAPAWNGWRCGLHPSAVAGSLVAGLVMLSVTAIFLLALQWSQVWPIFLILGGIGTLVPSLLGRRARPQEDAAVTRS